MSITTGLQVMGTYTSGTLAARIASLLALIPDPDTRESPTPRNNTSGLDEMAPMTAAQLRVELAALAGGADAGGDGVAYGQYTVVAADDTANLVNIVTGLADTSLANIGVCISRSGSLIANGTITEPSAGTIRIAEKAASAVGATDAYAVTADDIITWFAIDPAA